MQNTMNNRWGIPCYSFVAIYPDRVVAFFARLVNFLKAAFAAGKADRHGLSNATQARLYP